MKLFQTERVPEPEVMDEAAEVEAYTSAAAQAYLEQIDRTFVEHVARLFARAEPRGLALDLGCGPGQIPIMMAQRWPGLRIVGLDAAPHMIEQARKNAAQAKVAVTFQTFRATADANGSGRLPFDTGTFDLVTCNSVLHHLSAPVPVLDEIARIAKPGGAVLVRDLRRPAAIVMGPHIWWHGRHYSGEMKRLYTASVRAAYTAEELRGLLALSKLNDGRSRVFQHQRTHLGIERAAA
jgi:2-polyprenyl-3-methyl-5-hydroxy-6-metoxy-1,4-benzoquinol methylase